MFIRKPRPHRAQGQPRGNSRSSAPFLPPHASHPQHNQQKEKEKEGYITSQEGAVEPLEDSLSAPGPPYDDQFLIQHFLDKEKGKT